MKSEQPRQQPVTYPIGKYQKCNCSSVCLTFPNMCAPKETDRNRPQLRTITMKKIKLEFVISTGCQVSVSQRRAYTTAGIEKEPANGDFSNNNISRNNKRNRCCGEEVNEMSLMLVFRFIPKLYSAPVHVTQPQQC